MSLSDALKEVIIDPLTESVISKLTELENNCSDSSPNLDIIYNALDRHRNEEELLNDPVALEQYISILDSRIDALITYAGSYKKRLRELRGLTDADTVDDEEENIDAMYKEIAAIRKNLEYSGKPEIAEAEMMLRNILNGNTASVLNTNAVKYLRSKSACYDIADTGYTAIVYPDGIKLYIVIYNNINYNVDKSYVVTFDPRVTAVEKMNGKELVGKLHRLFTPE